MCREPSTSQIQIYQPAACNIQPLPAASFLSLERDVQVVLLRASGSICDSTALSSRRVLFFAILVCKTLVGLHHILEYQVNLPLPTLWTVARGLGVPGESSP